MRVLSPRFSSRHFSAGLRTATASRYTRLHVPNAPTILGALSADFRALAADVLVVFGADEHEMRRGPADFRTGHHKLEVLRLGMFAARFEAVSHGHRQALAIASETIVDAGFHFV